MSVIKHVKTRILGEHEGSTIKGGLTDNNWEKTLIKTNSTIQCAISKLDKAGKQILLVVTDNNELIGTITDGDIRRGILTRFGHEFYTKGTFSKETQGQPNSFVRQRQSDILLSRCVYR